MPKHNLMVAMPVARGVTPSTVACIFNIRSEVEKHSSLIHLSQLHRMPLDLARNELATVFLSTTCDMALLIDDDIQIAPEWAPKMMAALDAGCDIVSAPCRMRSEGNLFNIVPLGEPTDIGGLRVVECAWTGLGAVMVARRVFEKLMSEMSIEHYRSTVMPERTSAAMFKSRVEPAKKFFIEAPEDLNVYLLDDRAWSLRCHEAGFKIHAAIDVPTVHDGMTGCFSEEAEKLSRLQAREAARGASKLVGVDGKAI